MKFIGSILFLACYANAAEIIVNDTPGEGDFTTIQAAELAASDGDTIVINPNSDSRGYREEVIVTTPNLTITGSSKKSSKRRGRILRKTTNKKGSSKKLQNKGNRELGGKGGKGGDSFPFDALDDEGFPSLFEQPGCSDVFLDGCIEGGSCDNTVLTIRAPGVTIESLFIRHGDIEFAVGSDGGKLLESCILGDTFPAVQTSGSPNSLTISNNFFQGGNGHSVDLDGDSHEISSNLVAPCDNGFQIDGDDGLITNNKLFGCNDEAIEYDGDRGTITDNEIYHSDYALDYDGNDGIISGNTIIGAYEGIEYHGDNGRVIDNKISSAEYDGIDYYGDNGIIANNEISSISDDGIDYFGDNPTIAHNSLKFIQADGIRVVCTFNSCTGGEIAYNEIIGGGADDDDGIDISRAKKFVVEYNTISFISEIGLNFSGDDSTIRGNIIARGGTESPTAEHGMEISGNDNFIEENTVNFYTFDGISQDRGDNNVYRGNTVNGNGRAGIRVESGTGTMIVMNTVIDNHGEGISIEGGTRTKVLDNEVEKNRIDICNNVLDTFAADNTFTTGGFSATCESGLT